MPDSETLRRAALHASWGRDHRVGRRRRWWRWTVWAFWAFWRYGLPLLLVTGTVSAAVLIALAHSLEP